MTKFTYIFIFLLTNSLLLSNSANRNTYSLSEEFKGERLYISSFNDEVKSYLLKYNIADGHEYIYSWNGLKRENAKGVSLGSIRVLKAKNIENSLSLIWRSQSDLFFGTIDESLNISNQVKLNYEFNQIANPKIDFDRISDLEFLILIDKFLYQYSIDTKALTIVDENVLCYSPTVNNEFFKYAFLKFTFNSGIVYFVSNDNVKYESSRIEISEDNRMYEVSNHIIVISEYPDQSLLQIIKTGSGFLKKEWLEAKSDYIEILSDSSNSMFAYLIKDEGSYSIIVNKFNDDLSFQNINSIKLETTLIEPLAFELINNTIYVLFKNGLVSCDINGELLSSDFIILDDYISKIEASQSLSSNLILTSETGSVVFRLEENDYWWIADFYYKFQPYLMIMILLSFIILLVQLFRHSRRTISTLIELPTAGAVFMLDRTGKLMRSNDQGKEVLDITENVPKRKQFHYYCMRARTQPIMELIDKAMESRENINQKINIMIGDESKEWLCNVQIIRNVTGAYRGLIFTGIDITEELERKRLTNWAQLAHDMQTNLSTIRLNTERIEIDENEENTQRRAKIIHQTNLLIQRVRDIVTVGRSDKLDLTTESSKVLCLEVLNEFDSQLFPHVQMKSDLQDFPVSCDKPRMIRAIRNAIENGIRAIRDESGTITLYAYRDSRSAYFSVHDTGIGLKKEEIDKILTPYYTTSKHLGGSGIGTMIMQRVAELHGGKIEIKSDLGVGTQITFIIPNKSIEH